MLRNSEVKEKMSKTLGRATYLQSIEGLGCQGASLEVREGCKRLPSTLPIPASTARNNASHNKESMRFHLDCVVLDNQVGRTLYNNKKQQQQQQRLSITVSVLAGGVLPLLAANTAGPLPPSCRYLLLQLAVSPDLQGTSFVSFCFGGPTKRCCS
ncbi:unnamed protein product [Polarella glacialis]|uniref:Uncharacterized protein n=1 Tax=Polarella glacialis TaxID=89957 RepID=A0A813DYQ5_POLGL|nr:unnamed protein product [Polarella glacialis]